MRTPTTFHGFIESIDKLNIEMLEYHIHRSTVDLDFVDFGDAEEKNIGEVISSSSILSEDLSLGCAFHRCLA